MGLTPAQKQKRYRERINADIEKREEYLRKMRVRSQTRRDMKIDKPIAELSERSKRQQRKEWRERKQRSRKAAKTRKHQLEPILSDTPPASPNLPKPEPSEEHNVEHYNTIRGRKKVRKDRSAAYRRIKQLEKHLDSAKKQINKYKKKISRIKNSKNAEEVINSETIPSPMTKMNAELGDQSIPETVKRKLLFQDALITEIRDGYKTTNEKAKQLLVNICKGKHIKKYGFVKRVWANDKKHGRSRERVKTRLSQIRKFYCRDDNSIQIPGKKQTITFRGIKKQKRLLSGNLKDLHEKFCTEFYKLSFATFCRYRPFWVVKAKLTDRDSCLCKKHDNLQKKIDALIKEKATEERNIENLCCIACCNVDSVQCMTNKCDICKNRDAVSPAETVLYDKVIQWFVWKTEKVEIEKNGKKIVVTKTIKAREDGKVGELIEAVNREIKEEFCKHVFTIRHQFKESRRCKDELCYDEAAVHMDFSENYTCKLSSEIQAMHFGASHEQVTLHTVVVYYENEKKMFCTVSASRNHGPSAIWAHLTPILLELQAKKIDTIHFFSDGPVTQYKNKDNIYLLKTYFHDMGFKYGTWNYSESYHGKGAPDGVGAAIKRISDNIVSKGSDISNAKQLFQKVRDKTTVNMHFIEESKIDAIKEKLGNKQITKIPGILSTHQVISLEGEHHIYERHYSCFCKKLPIIDNCFNLRKIQILEEKKPEVKMSNNLAINQWVVVIYNKELFPGIISNIGDQVYEVKVLKKIGENKYIWPIPEDKIWYKETEILFNISAPTNITKRLLTLNAIDWEALIANQQIFE